MENPVCMLVGLHFGFSHPQQLVEMQLCNLSSGSTTKIRIELHSSSSSSVSQPLDLHPLLLCNLERKKTCLHPSVLCLHLLSLLCHRAPLFPRGSPVQYITGGAGRAIISMGHGHSLPLPFQTLPVCNKTQGPAVALIELWDHISAALQELDRFSMSLCCRLVPIKKQCMCVSYSSPDGSAVD